MYLRWREYRIGNPEGYGYTQFCYHVNQYTEAQKPSFVLSPDRDGGQYLFVDFAGDTMSYVDIETGEEVPGLCGHTSGVGLRLYDGHPLAEGG